MKKKPQTNKIIEGETLHYNAMQERRYRVAIDTLITRMIPDVKRKVIKLFKSDSAREFFAEDESIASQARIVTNALMAKFEAIFARTAPNIAETMVKGANVTSKASVASSIDKMSDKLSISFKSVSAPMKEIMKASVAENVSLIKSIGKEYLTNVQGAVYRSITTGNGLQSLIPALEKYEGITYRKAKNIALDQTRKVYSALNKERMENVGVDEFIWQHSGGGMHPRPEHVARDGQVFSFDNLPPGDDGLPEYPGQAINCGCTMKPVIKFDEDKNDDSA